MTTPVRPAREVAHSIRAFVCGRDVHAPACDRLTAAIEADRAENARACRALEGELRASRSREEAAVRLLTRWFHGRAPEPGEGHIVDDVQRFLATWTREECNQCGAKREPWQDPQSTFCPYSAHPDRSCDGTLVASLPGTAPAEPVVTPPGECVKCIKCRRCCGACDCTGGPQTEPECTCYELTGGHQPGCCFNARRSPDGETRRG